ncbi:MAG TPA: hypothetical protein VHC69_33995 [Polyangiaceae bacterium]|nr:hypothetical protein [Polyangiaceae bacterium]
MRFEGCHLTRHTMITWARRGGAPADVLESVTHNAAGAIIDQYTHWDWEPLCKAVACIDYGTAVELEHDASATAVPLPEPQAAASKYGAPYGVLARTGQNHGNFRWTRLQPIRTAAQVDLEFVVSTADAFGFQRIGGEARRMRRLGMSLRTIGAALGVDEKTVRKSLARLAT